MKITMHRYQADWPMVERGWNAHVRGEGRQFATAMDALNTLRAETGVASDQDLPAFVIAENGEPVGKIVDHGKEICLPSGMTEMGPVTKKLYETLTGIQMGRIEAPKGWIHVIE